MAERLKSVFATASFQRAFKRYIRKPPHCVKRINDVIRQLGVNEAQPSLSTHALQGKHSGRYACSAGYDLRIVFKIDDDAKLIGAQSFF